MTQDSPEPAAPASPEHNPAPSRGSDATPTARETGRLNGAAILYLVLAIAGAIAPWLANLDYMRAHPGGFDVGLFLQLANANPAAQSLSRDLAIGATAVLIWIVRESRRLRMRGLWLVLLCCIGVAFACGAPLFLHLRERRLLELEREQPAPG